MTGIAARHLYARSVGKADRAFFCVFHVKQVAQHCFRIIDSSAYPCDGYEHETSKEKTCEEAGAEGK